MNYKAKSLNETLYDDFVAYFEYKGSCSGCWCMNHRLPLGLDFEGEAAKLAMQDLIQTNRVFGILAYAEGDKIPVGWCALDQRRTLPGHDCIAEDINCSEHEWSIHCVTSRSDYKNKGVEDFLVSEATALAKEYKATHVEAYPEPKSQSGSEFKTWNSFNGFESKYFAEGFERVDKELGECSEFFSVVRKTL